MKKMFLFLAVFMISASSFATVVHFSSSCGRSCTYTTDAAAGSAQMTQELIALNGDMCGTTAVRIVYI